MSEIAGVVFGAFGGVAGELLGLVDIHQPELLPAKMKNPGLWLSLFIQAVVAGVLVAAYLLSGFKLNPILCVNLGAATPTVIKGFIRQLPAVTPGKID